MCWNKTFNFSISEYDKGAPDAPMVCLCCGCRESRCKNCSCVTGSVESNLCLICVVQSCLCLHGVAVASGWDADLPLNFCAGPGNGRLLAVTGNSNPLSCLIHEGICRDRILGRVVFSH